MTTEADIRRLATPILASIVHQTSEHQSRNAGQLAEHIAEGRRLGNDALTAMVELGVMFFSAQQRTANSLERIANVLEADAVAPLLKTTS